MHPLIPLALASQMVLGNPGLTALNDGARAIDRNDIAQGMELTQQALDSEFLMLYQTAKAHNNMCAAFYKLKLYEEALKHCDTAISISANSWIYYNNRAGVYLGLGRLDDALADYRTALALNPTSERLKENVRMAVRYLDIPGDETRPGT
jgi:tetratricopeptide (TPR) repeat protein